MIGWKGDCVPGPRLTPQERSRIEAMWISGLTFPEIAAALGRDRSTASSASQCIRLRWVAKVSAGDRLRKAVLQLGYACWDS